MLVRVGDRADAIVEALRQRGIFVRDRSSEPGCAGCIRITTGVVEHTAQRASRRWRRSCAPRA